MGGGTTTLNGLRGKLDEGLVLDEEEGKRGKGRYFKGAVTSTLLRRRTPAKKNQTWVTAGSKCWVGNCKRKGHGTGKGWGGTDTSREGTNYTKQI